MATVPAQSTCLTPLVARCIVSRAAADVCGETWPGRLRAVILTGSIARDEATVGVAGLLGDAELILVTRRGGIPQRELRAAEREIARRVEPILHVCPVHLGVLPVAALRRLPPHIFAYELRACGRVVWGDASVLSEIPGYPAAALPLADAWYLLSNRLVEWLEAAARAPRGDAAASDALAYATTKLGLDLATSYLVFRHAFVPGYAARNRVIQRQAAAARKRSAVIPIRSLASLVACCTACKLDARPLVSSPERQRAILLLALRLWNWELRRLSGAPAHGPSRGIWRRAAAQVPYPRRARGWMFALRAMGWRWQSGWLRLARVATPRWWIYRAAAVELTRRLRPDLPTLRGGLEMPRAERPSAAGNRSHDSRRPAGATRVGSGASTRSWLPVPFPPGGARPGRRALALAIAWNYHTFVETTRA